MKITRQDGSETKLGPGDKVVFFTDRCTMRFIKKDGEELRLTMGGSDDNQFFLDSMRSCNQGAYISNIMFIICLVSGLDYRLIADAPSGVKYYELF